MVRVRFAPSPTGYLHIGSVRTALFNWLYARSQGGIFILRIEDTDQKRSSDVYMEEIIADMKWLGLNWDEGPYFQTKRFDIYRSYAQKLLEKELAYKDGEAIIFKIPDIKVKIYDLVHGEIEVDNTLIDDLVLMKSDGSPAYNFACVVDDIEMQITHVIRGDDHISNTNKQVAVYDALGVKPPKFAHIPLILGPDKAPLSKRFGAVSITDYRAMGYLPQALVNYLSLLGWAPGDNKEFMSAEEIVKKFSLKRINKTGAEFNLDKLRWINGEHIRKLTLDEFVKVGLEFIKPECDEAWFRKFAGLYHSRVKTLAEFKEEFGIFISDDVRYNEEATEKFLKRDGVSDILNITRKRFEKVDPFTQENIEKEVRALVSELKIESADLIHPLRVAVTGKAVSAGVFEVLALLGKDKVLNRLARVIEDDYGRK
ncbi:MAG: glutamate--tRNA ligase [Candidatus Omnitrophica bacterium CG_4_9_14_0_2_um_filter_42_8]|nr:MAG: glutamate--tRNA ligase [Candidatus Omnitrophica bacterium CG22_combo_CG10-13_8_21_14_all_43_16]PJC47215.1 MAG: glutamate--tRNA ligase [Candidatus Omnitrophica bacterium CG_4_9_14_0_2_um_filter_42_8]